MEGDFKQCPNGHYYQGATCPYCKSTGENGTNASKETYVQGDFSQAQRNQPQSERETRINNNIGNGQVPTGNHTIANPGPSFNIDPAPRMHTSTIFEDNDDGGMSNAREARRLVGWLVSYSLDPMGVDFKLYEGRNIIGRGMNCNITVNDNMVSSEHAVLLYRANKYSITDRQSSHGTFVNGQDIDLEPMYLEDGDRIRVGKTEFLFRKSM
jgi:hypothetical protein